MEYAIWQGGAAPALDVHFHEEIQIVFVLEGLRAFEIAGETVTVSYGQCLRIPAMTPHRSLSIPHQTTQCLNIYLKLSAIEKARGEIQILSPTICGIEKWTDCTTDGFALTQDDALLRPNENSRSDMAALRVQDMARQSSMTREAFTRRFVRNTGITPQAFILSSRANRARQLLRSDISIAEAAAEAGFSDQSHLGRHFRRMFGTTPGAYRRSLTITSVPD